MIEYVVILAALTTALLAAGSGSIGLSKDDDQSLLKAMHERYTTQAYAISISPLPEGRDLAELAEYYESLDKFPTLASNLQDADVMLSDFVDGISRVNETIDILLPYTDPDKVIDDLENALDVEDEVVDALEDWADNALNPF